MISCLFWVCGDDVMDSKVPLLSLPTAIEQEKAAGSS